MPLQKWDWTRIRGRETCGTSRDCTSLGPVRRWMNALLPSVQMSCSEAANAVIGRTATRSPARLQLQVKVLGSGGGPSGTGPHRSNRRPRLSNPCRLPPDPGVVQTVLAFSPRGSGPCRRQRQAGALGLIGPSNGLYVAGRCRSGVLRIERRYGRTPSTGSERFRRWDPYF